MVFLDFLVCVDFSDCVDCDVVIVFSERRSGEHVSVFVTGSNDRGIIRSSTSHISSFREHFAGSIIITGYREYDPNKS